MICECEEELWRQHADDRWWTCPICGGLNPIWFNYYDDDDRDIGADFPDDGHTCFYIEIPMEGSYSDCPECGRRFGVDVIGIFLFYDADNPELIVDDEPLETYEECQYCGWRDR